MDIATIPGPAGMIDRGVQRHIGSEIRALYEGGVPPELPDEMLQRIAELRVREHRASDFRERVEARLVGLTNADTVFLADCPAFGALCADYAAGRHIAYTLFCEIIWLFGKTRVDSGRTLIPPDMSIYDWGGWPRYIGVPDGNTDLYWHRFTMAMQPKSDAEWTYFSESAATFAFSMMIRHRMNPDFWTRLSWMPGENLRRASERMLTALSA